MLLLSCVQHPGQQQILSTPPQKLPVCFLLSTSSITLVHHAMAFPVDLTPPPTQSSHFPFYCCVNVHLNRVVTVRFDKSPLKPYTHACLKPPTAFRYTPKKNVLPCLLYKALCDLPPLLTSGESLYLHGSL